MNLDLLIKEVDSVYAQVRDAFLDHPDVKKLGIYMEHLTLATLDKLVKPGTPDAIINLLYLMTLKTYFKKNVGCDRPEELFVICQHIAERYRQLGDVTKGFIEYTSSRLETESLTLDKLGLIDLIYHNQQDLGALLELADRKIVLFFERLNNKRLLKGTQYFSNKLVGPLILNIYLNRAKLDRSVIIDFFVSLQSKIEHMHNIGYIRSFVQFNNALAYLNEFTAYNYRVSSDDLVSSQIQSSCKDCLRLLNSLRPSMDDIKHLTNPQIRSLMDIKSNVRVLEEEPAVDICIDRKSDGSMSISRGKYQNTDVVIKWYIIQNESRLYSHFKEIKSCEIADSIRIRLPSETCFLQYFGTYFKEETNEIALVMSSAWGSITKAINNRNSVLHKLTQDELKTIFKKLIRSFYELRKCGIQHCDIKPENLLISNDKQISIIDFNLCSMDINYRAEESVRGTRVYASPEVEKAMIDVSIEKLRYDTERSDIFSLGIVFMEFFYRQVMSGKNKYENYGELKYWAESIEWEWAKSLILRMIRIDPWERPTFEELKIELSR